MKFLFAMLLVFTIFLSKPIDVYPAGCSVESVVLGDYPDWIYEADVVNTDREHNIVVCINQIVFFGSMAGYECSANDCEFACSFARTECITILINQSKHVSIPCEPDPGDECQRYVVSVTICDSTPECTAAIGCSYDSLCIPIP